MSIKNPNERSKTVESAQAVRAVCGRKHLRSSSFSQGYEEVMECESGEDNKKLSYRFETGRQQCISM